MPDVSVGRDKIGFKESADITISFQMLLVKRWERRAKGGTGEEGGGEGMMIISWGAGVNSTAIIALFLLGKLKGKPEIGRPSQELIISPDSKGNIHYEIYEYKKENTKRGDTQQ